MATSLDDVRARFAVVKSIDVEHIAMDRIKVGHCPACGSKRFMKLICRDCSFVGHVPTTELDTPEAVEQNLAEIAAAGVKFRNKLPVPEDGVDSTEQPSLAQLELLKMEAERRHARSTVEDHTTDGGARFAIEKDPVTGKVDAVIQFGQWSGHCVSDMVTQPNSAEYLRWILAADFPSNLKDIVRYYLGLLTERT